MWKVVHVCPSDPQRRQLLILDTGSLALALYSEFSTMIWALPQWTQVTGMVKQSKATLTWCCNLHKVTASWMMWSASTVGHVCSCSYFFTNSLYFEVDTGILASELVCIYAYRFFKPTIYVCCYLLPLVSVYICVDLNMSMCMHMYLIICMYLPIWQLLAWVSALNIRCSCIWLSCAVCFWLSWASACIYIWSEYTLLMECIYNITIYIVMKHRS